MIPVATALPAFTLLVSLSAQQTAPEVPFGERLHAETNVTGGLTAETAAHLAEARSGEVASRRAEIDVAAAAVDQALVAYFPRLSGRASYSRLSSFTPPLLGTLVTADAPAGPLPATTQLVNVQIRLPVPINATTFEATLTVPVSDYLLRIGQTYAAAEQSETSARETFEAARLKTRADAKTLYYTWSRAKLSCLVADAAVAQASGHLDDARKAFDAGISSRADVLRVEAQLASADQLAVSARTLTTVLEERLRTIMHVERGGPFAIGEPVDTDFVFDSGVRDLDRLATEAERARPEIRAIEASIAGLNEQVSAAHGSEAPSLSLIGVATDANPNVRYVPSPDKFETTWSVTAQLTWSPNDAITAAKAARAVVARREQATAQRTTLLDGLRSEIASALQSVEESESAQQTAARAVTAAEESYRVRRALFQNGRATSVELTDAETELTRARLDLIDARINARISMVAFQHAAGRDAG